MFDAKSVTSWRLASCVFCTLCTLSICSNLSFPRLHGCFGLSQLRRIWVKQFKAIYRSWYCFILASALYEAEMMLHCREVGYDITLSRVLFEKLIVALPAKIIPQLLYNHKFIRVNAFLRARYSLPSWITRILPTSSYATSWRPEFIASPICAWISQMTSLLQVRLQHFVFTLSIQVYKWFIYIHTFSFLYFSVWCLFNII
jgi:hypothetical protein